MKKVMLVIPALNPPRELINYVKLLGERGYHNILVIDDGSSKDYKYIFDEIDNMHSCNVLTHSVNEGKGKALKDAFAYFQAHNYKNGLKGIITADSDGQHHVDDIDKIAFELEKDNSDLLLGSRDFEDISVPPKSKFGNKLTRKIMKLFYGINIQDTQTGLRGIPSSIVPLFIDLKGERFEYETNMLIACAKEKIRIKEIEIQTIYIDGNSETHFNPVVDSIKIYMAIFSQFIGYIFSALCSSIVDLGIFSLFTYCVFSEKSSRNVLYATIIARVVSSLFNYTVNGKFVFKSKKRIKSTLIKYYILAICQMFTSGVLVGLLSELHLLSTVIIKIIIDTCLFFVSYNIQKKIIF